MQITAQSAVDYVKAHFAKRDEPTEVLICGVGPSAETIDEPEEMKAIDVYFLLNDGSDEPSRFTVWIERYPDHPPFIYGEW